MSEATRHVLVTGAGGQLGTELQRFSTAQVTIRATLPISSTPPARRGGLKTLYVKEVRRINVSLDSLDADRFRFITRHGDLAEVLHGIAAHARVSGVASGAR